MPTTMKAVVLESNGSLTYTDVPFPEPDTDRPVLVKVDACGVCGSDLKRAFRGGAYGYPLIMGHEFSGTIEEIPDGFGYQPGERVTVFPLIPCLRCDQCLRGAFARCEDYDYLGSRCDGAFSQYVRVPVMNLVKIPDRVPSLHAAMCEPCAVARHGARKLNVASGGAAVVFGGGPVGNMSAQWLRSLGADPVMVVDILEDKLRMAEDMGFIGIDSSTGNPVARVIEVTRGAGADLCIEACGLPLTFLQALRAAATAAQICFMGNIEGDLTISEKDFSSILRRELTIYGTWNSTFSDSGGGDQDIDDWRGALAAMGRDIEIESIISHVEPLERAPRILEEMASGALVFGKVLFQPHRDNR